MGHTEQEAIDGVTAYRLLDFLADVRKGIWSEFYGGAAPRVDAYRRNLQRAEEGLFDPAKAPESLDRLRDNSQEGGVGVEPAWIHGRALCVDRRPWIVARTGFT